jgi:hypothetical protein
MAESKPSRKLVTLSPDIVRRLDDYRFGSRIGRESEALRQLIEIGLDRVEGDRNRQARVAR